MARLFQTHERMFMTSPFAAADDKPSTEKPGPLGGDLPGGDRRMPGNQSRQQVVRLHEGLARLSCAS